MKPMVLFASALLCSCASAPLVQHAYPGAPRPASETARITMDSQRGHGVLVGLDDRIYFTAVDGQPTQGTALQKYPDEVFVLPGERRLSLVWGNGFTIAKGCLTVPALANHAYVIRQDARKEGVYLWAEDLASGQSVTGTAKDAKDCPAD